MNGNSPSGEQGSATVWVVALMVAVWTAAGTIALVGAIRVARHRAQSAADLGALAAAATSFSAPAESCQRAKKVIEANDARMPSCSVAGGNVDLTVVVDVRLPVFGRHQVTASAKAGPVTTPIRAGDPPSWSVT